jgi:S1-C subfamily serine protease
VEERVQPGDVITEVNGVPVRTVEDFENEIRKVEAGAFVRLYMIRVDQRSGQAQQYFALAQVPE